MMESIPPRLFTALADDYRQTAHGLCVFQLRNWAELSITQQLDVNACQNSLFARAQDLDERNVSPFFTNAVNTVENALLATARGRQALATTQDVAIGLSIGAVLVALAAGISRASIVNIDIAFRELNELIEILEGERVE